MWRNIWPDMPEAEVPIIHVTNGVHARSWLSGELIYLFDRYLGARWQTDPVDQSVWQYVNDIPDEELWRVHERRRQRLVVWTRRRLRRQLEARGASAEQLEAAGEALNPNALTVGFARRFATYKRANLLLRDTARLLRMFADKDRPIQFVIAGKAHPADGGGKDLIRQLVHFAREDAVGYRVVFVENYDINVARYLVQGCDVWLNTPRRGMEASGTSGMKAALNGVLNCSILDGWWDEAYENDLGWAIGRGETYANLDMQDEIESQALYDLLEKQIIPLYYDRDNHSIPRNWIARMKKCISTLAPAFNTNRMVGEYAEKLYLPALQRGRALAENELKGAVDLCSQKARLREHWGRLRVGDVVANTDQSLGVGESLELSVTVHLGELRPEEVCLQAYVGEVDNDGRIVEGRPFELSHRKDLAEGRHQFEGSIKTSASGRHGFALRILPGGKMFAGVNEPGLLFWDKLSGSTAEPKVAPAGVA